MSETKHFKTQLGDPSSRLQLDILPSSEGLVWLFRIGFKSPKRQGAESIVDKSSN